MTKARICQPEIFTTGTASQPPAGQKKAVQMTRQLLTVIDSGPLPRFWFRRVRLSPVGLHDVAQKKILQYCRSNMSALDPVSSRDEGRQGR